MGGFNIKNQDDREDLSEPISITTNQNHRRQKIHALDFFLNTSLYGNKMYIS